MEPLVPCVLFVLIVLALASVWRRPDPQHEFLLDMTRRLSESEAEPGPCGPQENLTDGSRSSAAGHNGARGASV
jgi:hypothetical protein